MSCFEDDPCCFGFIFFGAIFLLVGAGLCGSGSSGVDSAKALAGYVLLSIAGALIAGGLLYYTVRSCQRRRRAAKGPSGDTHKRRSRKKLAELPLAVPVNQPVPHWVVYPSGAAAVNQGLEEDYALERPRTLGSMGHLANGYSRPLPLRASPMAHSATTGDLLTMGSSERHTCRRNSIPSDPYDALWQYRQGEPSHATGAGGSFFALVSMPSLCEQHQQQRQSRHPPPPQHPEDSPCYRPSRSAHTSPAWRAGAYAVSPPVFV